MKTFYLIILTLALPLAAQCAEEEDQLLGVLQSDQSLQEKDAACARLKWIGTTKSVPVLADLLTNGDLSHSARYALESMPGPEAEEALRGALAKTAGSTQIGIIDSLAVRGEPVAAPDLGALLSSADTNAAVAAAHALGHLRGSAALETLQPAWAGSTSGRLHEAETDALLACANRLLTDGGKMQASGLFQQLYDKEKTPGVRLAAFRGLILCSDKQGIDLMVKAIAGDDGPSQGAALQMAATAGGSDATKALADLLPTSPAPVQIALLQCLARRGDAGALVAVMHLIDSADADVRLAAVTALGDLGDDSAALPLALRAASASAEEKAAARQSLIDLRRGAVTKALLKPISSETPAVRAELIRALGDRNDASAAPQLLELARGANEDIRSASLQALGLLGGQAQVPGLIELVVNATNDDSRSEAADALSSTCQHIQSQAGLMDTSGLVQAVKTAPLDARVALLGVCGGVSDAQVRDVLLADSSDTDARVRDAAVRALCNTHDAKLLPNLLKLASAATENKFRLLAVTGCVRLATQDEGVKLSSDEQISTLKTILDAPLTTAEKRQVLAGLGTIHDAKALALATPMLDDLEVRTEAAEAVIHIAGSISRSNQEEAGAALKKVLAMTSIDPATQKSAQNAFKKIQ